MRASLRHITAYIFKWLAVAAILGSGGAAAAVALRTAIQGVQAAAVYVPLWLAPAIGGLGAALIGLWDRRALGFGANLYIHSVNRAGGRLPLRLAASKLAATAVTLGCFGSGGLTGPMLVVGGSLANTLDRLPCIRRLFSRGDRRLLTICGAAGALGAIFHAPLGGGIFAVEVLFRSSLHYADLFPAMMSSAVGFVVYNLLGGPAPLFLPPEYVPRLLDLPLFLAAAVGAGIVSVLYMRVFGFVRLVSDRARLRFVHPLVGGALTGLVLLAAPRAAGLGLETMQAMIDGTMPALVLLALFLSKILATSFTVGAGGSGGLVFPALFVGAAVGSGAAAVFGVTDPGLNASLATAGMASCLAGIANVPIAAAVMLTEMVGLRLSVPAVLGGVIGYAIGKAKVIYGDDLLYTNTAAAVERSRGGDRDLGR